MKRRSHRKLRSVPAQFVPNFLTTLDQRFAPSIAARRTYDELVEALGGGEDLSPQRRLLIERATWTSLILAKQEIEFATSGQINLSDYTQATHALVSLLGKLGLNRVPKDVPSLAQYIARQGGHE